MLMCIYAEDAMATLVLLPFHRAQRLDVTNSPRTQPLRLSGRHEKVLQLAPCSVGVMVDQGIGSMPPPSSAPTPSPS